KREQPALLVGRERFPERQGDDPHGHVGRHHGKALPHVRPPPHEQPAQHGDPDAPGDGREGEDEADGRRGDEDEEGGLRARPKRHCEQDGDEHYGAARSGCSSTSANGTPTIRPGGSTSRSVTGASRRAASRRASIRMTASLASSAGWPTRRPPIASQDLEPAAVPAPVPTTRVTSSSNR